MKHAIFFLVLILYGCGSVKEHQDGRGSSMEIILSNDNKVIFQGEEISLGEFEHRFKEEEKRILAELQPDSSYSVEVKVAKEVKMSIVTSVMEVFKKSDAKLKVLMSQI